MIDHSVKSFVSISEHSDKNVFLVVRVNVQFVIVI